MAEVRKRLSHKSVEQQTSQWQPICGTPVLVPVPKNLNRGINYLFNKIGFGIYAYGEFIIHIFAYCVTQINYILPCCTA